MILNKKLFIQYCLFLLLFFNVEIEAQEQYIVEKIEGAARESNVELIVIHATGGPDCDPNISFKSGTLYQIIQHFKRNQKKISIHYIIGRNGDVVKMVEENEIAYHVRGYNYSSIGIELVNNGDGKDTYSNKQIESLISLLKQIIKRHKLSIEQIKGHELLDNSELNCNGKILKRKQDPGANFPWELLRKKLEN